MKGIINKVKFLQLAFFTFLLLGSSTTWAQSSSNSGDATSFTEELIEQVNINLADAETIAMVLDGVGLSRAEAIVDYRELNGEFKAVDDLIMVAGIGEVTLRNNMDKILLGSE